MQDLLIDDDQVSSCNYRYMLKLTLRSPFTPYLSWDTCQENEFPIAVCVLAWPLVYHRRFLLPLGLLLTLVFSYLCAWSGDHSCLNMPPQLGGLIEVAHENLIRRKSCMPFTTWTTVCTPPGFRKVHLFIFNGKFFWVCGIKAMLAIVFFRHPKRFYTVSSMSVYMITFFVILTVYYGSLLSSFVQLSYMYLNYVLLIGSVLLSWQSDLSLRSHISVSIELILNRWNSLLIRLFLFPFALLKVCFFLFDLLAEKNYLIS